MIVRINQFDSPRPEAESGWPSEGRLGPILAPWPEGTKAYEILILEHDELRRPMSESFRQQQLRRLIPQAVSALSDPGEQAIVRLDGPLAERELLPAYRYLTDSQGRGKFVVNGVEKLDDAAKEVYAGIRIAPTSEHLSALCADSSVGLERSVRLRVLCVPEAITNSVLEIDSPDDERWADILRQTGFIITTVRGLLSLHILTARFEASVLKSRLMQHLAAAAVPKIPAGV